jgi:hypothetical protein
MAKRRYKGCELLSPTYRKVAAEMARSKNANKDYQPYKSKNKINA